MTQAVTSDQIILYRSLFSGLTDRYGTYDPRTGRYRQEKEPVTDDVIRRHLLGIQPYGVYLLTGDTTRAVVVDFDQEDTEAPLAYLEQARHYGLTSYLERSRRRGWHAYLWLSQEGVPAKAARTVARLILSEAVPGQNVEVFPKQDRLSGPDDSGCFLNAPLWGRLTPLGRTVFVDPARGLQPYPDQWEFLAGVRRFSAQDLQTILELNAPGPEPPPRMARQDGVLPQTYGLPPCAQRMLAAGVTSNQRSSAFRLACQLRKFGLTEDVTVAALLACARKNRPTDGKRIITPDEIIALTSSAYRRWYRSCGCEDPAVAPFCDANCPVRGRRKHRRLSSET